MLFCDGRISRENRWSCLLLSSGDEMFFDVIWWAERRPPRESTAALHVGYSVSLSRLTALLTLGTVKVQYRDSSKILRSTFDGNGDSLAPADSADER